MAATVRVPCVAAGSDLCNARPSRLGRKAARRGKPSLGASASYGQGQALRRCNGYSSRLRRTPQLLPYAVLKPVVEGDSPDNELEEIRESMEAILAAPSASARREEIRKEISDGEYASLRGEFDREKLIGFFARRPVVVARRISVIARRANALNKLWKKEESLPASERTRGGALKETLTELGPVFVKIGQTLAERPDIVGDEAAAQLKTLQVANKPFENEIAFHIIAEDLKWDGPLAPDHPYQGEDSTRKPLFKKLTHEPIAAASLGQVYKAETWEGVEVAVKVQRPGVLKQVALDWTCWALGLEMLRRFWGSDVDLSEIADEVAVGVWKELDYRTEAANAQEFIRRHAFLGFVTAPKWLPEFSGPEGACRVLSSEWVKGAHLSNLPQERKLLLVQRAVEACVAQLLYTGYVHADPHEGNLMLCEDGRLAFLDFGLMSTVEPRIMEGFAQGIQYMIAGNWDGLVRVFREVGFTSEKPEKLDKATGLYVVCEPEELVEAVRTTLEGEEGGQSRFGALATGLTKLSADFKFLTPPYIVLLCRTFLTLEGIAEKADPDFNIYMASLPYAIKRALSPVTDEGTAALRSALLKPDNAIRWERLNEIIEQAEAAKTEEEEKLEEVKESSNNVDMAAVSGVLGTLEGAALRRVGYDACSLSLAKHLTSRQGRKLREQGIRMMAQLMVDFFNSRKEKEIPAARVELLETSPEYAEIMKKQQLRQNRALQVLLFGHLRRLRTGGIQGLVCLCSLVFVAMRMTFLSLVHASWDIVSTGASNGYLAVLRFLGSKKSETRQHTPRLES
mmetsp:Transcript_3655/g.13122  ORF Transcript_3655/g.13122 Transcript_3655/m.13122 type:complete len:796 (-) Transcript_3655:992-3379(-)